MHAQQQARRRSAQISGDRHRSPELATDLRRSPQIAETFDQSLDVQWTYERMRRRPAMARCTATWGERDGRGRE
eukprot:3831429-Pleurochrysis_carterae.AAC.1